MSNVDPKDGWKTTEFWLSLLAVFVGSLLASGVFDESDAQWTQGLGAIAAALAALGYSASRASTKGK